MRARAIIGAVLVAGVAVVSCSDLSRFSNDHTEDGGWGSRYRGTVIDASFVRAGVPAGAQMCLELDADALQSAPGQLWTDELAPGESFSGAHLLAIPQLANDPLSTFSFGEGRVKNTLAIAMLGGAQVFVVISLMQDGDVEVRLIRGTSPGSIPTGTPPTPSQIFGVFHLHKEDGNCAAP